MKEGLLSKWAGAYRLMCLITIVGLFTALFYSKLDGTAFVAGLGVTLGSFYAGGAVSAGKKD